MSQLFKISAAYLSAAAAVLAFGMAGCGGGGGTSGNNPGGGGTSGNNPGGDNGTPVTPARPVARVAISAPGDPAALSLNRGEASTVTATAYDAAGQALVVSGANWTWTVDNTNTLALSPSAAQAQLIGQDAGSTVIHVREATSGQEAQLPVVVNAVAPPAPGTAAAVYTNDFENGAAQAGPEWSKRTISATPAGGRRFLGELGDETLRLSLTNLPTHGRLLIRYDLYLIRSWDGSAAGVGPDFFRFDLENGPTLLNATFSNFNGLLQSYPGSLGSATQYPGQTGAREMNTLGYVYNTVGVTDSVYHFEHTAPHTASNAVLRFIVDPTNPEGLNNESWGVDNVEVIAAP